MIFLAQAGRNGIDGGRVAQHLVFRYQRGGGVLGNHEPRVDAGLAHQKRRQAVVPFQQQVGAPLRDAGQLGQRHGREIQRQRQRLAVEIAAGEDIAVLEDQRVVRNGIHLGFHHGDGVSKGIPAGAVHLGHAAQAVGVLHLAAMAMRFEDLAIDQHRADVGGDLLLPPMRA